MEAKPSTDPAWDFDIVEGDRLITRFCGGWVAVQNVIDALSERGPRNTEAREVAAAIRETLR